MDKRLYLPAIASLLILCITLSSFTPVMAATLRARAAPTLDVVTIAEDDEVRKTGVMILGLSDDIKTGAWPTQYSDKTPQEGVDKLSQHKVLVAFNGVPVSFTIVECQVVKKEKLHPLQKPQFETEQLRTVLTDESANFVCKFREGKPGVGVLDIYYIGDQEKQFIADYILVLIVSTTIGRTVVYGTEMQDICVLGWAMGETDTIEITKPSGDIHYSWPDPLGPFVGCEEAALWQRDALGLPILYD